MNHSSGKPETSRYKINNDRSLVLDLHYQNVTEVMGSQISSY